MTAISKDSGATYSLATVTYGACSPLSNAWWIATKIHDIWRYFREAQDVLIDIDYEGLKKGSWGTAAINGLLYAGGCIADFFNAGYFDLIKYPAIAVAIVRRVICLLQETRRLNDRIRKLHEVCFDKISTDAKVKALNSNWFFRKLCSASEREEFYLFSQRVGRMAILVLHVLKEFFFVLMRIWDVIEVCEERYHREHVRMGLVNIHFALRYSRAELEFLLEEFRSVKEGAQKLFKSWGISSPKSLTDSLEKCLVNKAVEAKKEQLSANPGQVWTDLADATEVVGRDLGQGLRILGAAVGI